MQLALLALVLWAAPDVLNSLERLPGTVLLDPRGAERVLVRFPVHTVWARQEVIERPAWRIPGAPGKAARFVLADGFPLSVEQTLMLATVDLVAEARQRLLKGRGDRFESMRDIATGHPRDPDLALSAWLAALGHRELAEELAKRPPGHERGARPRPCA